MVPKQRTNQDRESPVSKTDINLLVVKLIEILGNTLIGKIPKTAIFTPKVCKQKISCANNQTISDANS